MDRNTNICSKIISYMSFNQVITFIVIIIRTIVGNLRIFKAYLINLQNPSHYVKRSCSLRGKQFFVILNF